MSNVAGLDDAGRVKSLGVAETMVAVKSYGHYVSMLTHLAEESLTKTLADHGQLEGELRKAEEELIGCKLERARLQEDLKKHENEKARLDGVVESLTKENERLSGDMEQAKEDLKVAQAEVGRCDGLLKGVAAHFPELSAGSSLADAVDELKGSIALSFEEGFNLAIAQLRVVYLTLTGANSLSTWL